MADIGLPDPQNTAPKPFVFVLMPFDPKFDDIYKFGIKGAADDVGAYAERVDEQIFMEGILDRIFNQISKADVIVADMTGRNPNVFYEVGYAHALGKIVILLTQNSEDIPFDLKHRQHTVYGGRIETLRNDLAPKLEWAIREANRRTEFKVIERISLKALDTILTQGLGQENIPEVEGTVFSRIFQFPIYLRNDGLETFQGASHIYLFATEDCKVVPGRDNSIVSQGWYSTSNFTPSEPGTTLDLIPSMPFNANDMDAPDGLKLQFQLPITFSTLPPGAVEREYLGLMFKNKEDHQCDSNYRIRLHTKARFYDYPFKLRLKFISAEKKNGV